MRPAHAPKREGTQVQAGSNTISLNVQAIQRLAAHPQLAARVHAGPAGAHVGPAPLTRMGSGASGKSSRIMPVAAGVRDQRFADEQAAEMAELPLRVPAKGSTGPLAMQPVLPQQYALAWILALSGHVLRVLLFDELLCSQKSHVDSFGGLCSMVSSKSAWSTAWRSCFVLAYQMNVLAIEFA